MCLMHARLLSQKDDIKCYKLVKINEDGVMTSPFRTTKTWKVRRTYVPPDTWDGYNGTSVVKGKAYHTYKNYAHAREHASLLPCFKWAIIECIIPKTSKYTYIGGSSFDSKGNPIYHYASQKLKTVTILESGESEW